VDLCSRLARGASICEPVAVVVAHPDDEIVSLGGTLRQFSRLHLVHVTDGAPRDLEDARREGVSTCAEYARARQRELCEALDVAGVRPSQQLCLEAPDKQSAECLQGITERLLPVLAATDLVITHPYEQGHPDHDSAAFAVQAACALLRRAGASVPVILELASYHVVRGQPRFGEFWPDAECPETLIALSQPALARKAAARDCFRTQCAVLANFPLTAERIRVAPRYHFAECAPPGASFYDRLGWCMTSGRWRALASDAARALRVPEVL
jgi:LmbE family N-acetylglucosaminyl deacetylase